MSPAASTAREASAASRADFSPAGAEPRGDEGGGLEAPAARPSWFVRTRATFRNSVWAPVALKLMGLALAMLALSGVGAASALSGVDGVQVPLSSMLGADARTPWLANKSAARPRASSSGVSSLTVLSTASNPTASNSTASNPATSGLAPAAVPEGTGEGAHGAKSAGMTEDGKVILNLASAEDLRHLPGVGPKRADAILALRVRLGRFKQVSDLLRVKGIGVRGLKKLAPHVVLDAPRPSA